MGVADVRHTMPRTVKLNELESALQELDYPVDRDEAVTRYDDVTLRLADGEENLGATIAASGSTTFVSADDLATEVMNLLPQHAVGEPYQSEGEG